MLNLLDSVDLEGLTLYRDDVVPNKWYVLPDQPVIRQNDEGVPEFLFIKYMRAADDAAADVAGGYVQFRCTLAIAEERRQRLIEALRAQLSEEKARGHKPSGRTIDSTEPILAPPMWKTGSVGVETFSESDDGLVHKVRTTGLPDLGGDLAASVMLQLDRDGAEVFWTAFNKAQIPLLVGYQLTYLAAVTAGELTVRASRSNVVEKIWKQAQPYVWQPQIRKYLKIALPAAFTVLSPAALALLRTTHGVVKPALPKAQIREVIKTEITIESHSGVAGADEVPLDLREKMVELAGSLLTEDLVSPALVDGTIPGSLVEGGDDAIALLKEDKTESETSSSATFELKLRQDAVIERQVHPNGPLQLMFSPDELAGLFDEKRLDDGFFATLRVLATAEGIDFAAAGIALITVQIRYDEEDEVTRERVIRPTEEATKSLTPASPIARWRFDVARRSDGSHKRSFSYRTTINYVANVPPAVSDWQVSDVDLLTLSPRSLRALKVDVKLVASAETVASARVTLRYRTQDGRDLESALDLSPSEPARQWFQHTGELRQDDLGHPSYSYQIRWRLAGAGEVTSEWRTSSDEVLVVQSPFVRTLRFALQPQGFVAGVTRISGTLRYAHPERDYHLTVPFSLDAATASQLIAVPVLEGGPEVAALEWRATRDDGDTTDGTLEAREGIVWVGPGSVKSLRVEVNPMLLDFDADVELVVVRLRYGDRSHTLQFFKSDTGTHRNIQVWEVPLIGPEQKSFGYSVRYIAHDRAKSSEVTVDATEDTLVLLDRDTVSP